jgi:ankyrin repeat protein
VLTCSKNACEGGVTALMSATLNGHKRVVLALIEQGADVTLKNDHGGTALSIARAKQRDDLVNVRMILA